MRKMIALFVSIAFSVAVAGMAVAQTKPATDTSKPAAAGQEQKPAQEKTMDKKAAKLADRKAACLKKATTDQAKADCEKKYAQAVEKMEKQKGAQDKPTDKKEAAPATPAAPAAPAAKK